MLAETLMSLSVVAIVLPTTFAVLSLSLEIKRESSQDTKLAQIAQYVFSELPHAWGDSRSVVFPNETPYEFPDFGQAELHLLFTESVELYDSSGDLVLGDFDWKVRDPKEPQNQTLDATAGYVVTIRQEDFQGGGDDREWLKRFEIEISYPAGKPFSARENYTYSRLFSH